ncbi:hypothetical protein AGMMS49938_01200 [Fibrobacterales bacterium]|nr:hypothetical protein AGMMS49938_01200 [Fibrobacterales bacterium]
MAITIWQSCNDERGCFWNYKNHIKNHYYTHPHSTGDELLDGLTGYFDFYNNKRYHQSLDYKVPCDFYYEKKVNPNIDQSRL